MVNVPPYWEHLRATQKKVMEQVNAPNTVRAYAFTWLKFSQWCEEIGTTALPASESTVLNYTTFVLYEREPRYRIATLNLTLTAIAKKHVDQSLPSPVTPEVRTFVRNAKRDLRERKAGKAAITPRQLRRVCSFLSADSSNIIAIRDRAMFLLQFAAGWRCSEVISLTLADLRFTRKGFIVSLGASKTDQDGTEGRVVGIEYGKHEVTCPVRALRQWLSLRGTWRGGLFCRVMNGRITPDQLTRGTTVNRRFRDVLAQIGGLEVADYGSHSLRSGMVTSAIERGASETLIMMRTGHKSLDSMRRYVRCARAFRANPLAGVL